ncbi:MAG: TldD/PmbA family protein, partial [Deltaproteobacteria bacterium]|nr:TldD/PmbA family protein [Deltaproteobacteria bacterium]
MKDLITNVLDLAKLKRADYADIRIVRRQMEGIEVKNGIVEALTSDEDFGCGIRVLFQGAWGFAGSSKVNKQEMESIFNKAWKIAKGSSKAKGKDVFFPPGSPVVATCKTPISIDPFNASPENKLKLLLKADEIMRQNKKVKISEAFMGCYKTAKTFASTEGSYIEQEIIECGAGIAATAIEGGEVQVRSYPNSFRGNFATKGY